MRLAEVALAVFAKTPGLSPIKTRLGKSASEKVAAEFYQHAILAITELIQTAADQSQGNIQPYWAVAEQMGMSHPLWQDFPTVWTGDGSFGNRLNHVYETLLLQHQRVILIGTDSPQMNHLDIIEQTTGEDFALGPAKDGGFYLFAGSKLLPRHIWVTVPYSVTNTFEVLHKQLASQFTVDVLETKTDVDHREDLVTLHQELEHALLPGQQQLREWLEEHQLHVPPPRTQKLAQ